MGRNNNIFYLLLIALTVTACTQQRYVERIKVDTIKVASPVVEDSLTASVVTDTVVIANKSVNTDTVINIKYYPADKKFYVKVKPDTVTIFRTDTVAQVQIENRESPLYMIFWVLIITIVVVIILKLKK